MVFGKCMEIEEELGLRLVFVNGFRDGDQRASLGAYGTVISYTNLYTALEELPYTNEEWLEYAEYNEDHAYLAPTFKLLATIIKRKISSKINDIKTF